MNLFVQKNSIVRKIWGKGDTILFIFAGAAAEFALNKAVDWLYYTGRLPADPIGRLFSTVTYARLIVFSEEMDAYRAIDKIVSIHSAIEKQRGAAIPAWAYRDVLFMLIHYSIAAYELLERKLTEQEKEEVYHVFYRVGTGMRLESLPTNYISWLAIREEHMEHDLQLSHYSTDLFKQYKKHLGAIRYSILKQAQVLVVPKKVKQLLHFGDFSWLSPILPFYKLSRKLQLDWLVKFILLPQAYKQQIKDLDVE